MELQRANIEKRDFPQAKRGYDTDAVDGHLRAIADAVEQLKSAQPQQASLAGTAASRVEAIVAAAETSAREIEEKARAEADERVKSADASVAQVVARAQELQAEVAELVQRVSTLNSTVEPAAVEAAAAAPEAEPEPVSQPEPEHKPEPAPQAKKADGGASEGARLVALNMALSGTPRDETARYLQENYELVDADDLLDDVYARAGS